MFFVQRLPERWSSFKSGDRRFQSDTKCITRALYQDITLLVCVSERAAKDASADTHTDRKTKSLSFRLDIAVLSFEKCYTVFRLYPSVLCYLKFIVLSSFNRVILRMQ